MAAILSTAYPDILAAAGVHSGLPVGTATDLASALAAMQGGAQAAAATAPAAPPTIVFHGDQDHIVHPVNGEQAVVACAGAGLPRWSKARAAAGAAPCRRPAGGGALERA
jgi:poly(3-hydroxybutyrate) depolymerase